VTAYGYDARGNRTSVTDALNNQTTFTYNNMNRLTQIYAPGNIVTTFAYDNRGRRTSVSDANNKTTSYTYDDADRLLTVIRHGGRRTSPRTPTTKLSGF
jgi:YD repeat-containing protein